MANASCVPPACSSRDLLLEQKKHHKQAFAIISKALDLDEKYKESYTKAGLTEVIRQYKAGIVRLEEGIALDLDKSHPDYSKFSELKTKMIANLNRTKERVEILEKELVKINASVSKPSSFIKPAAPARPKVPSSANRTDDPFNKRKQTPRRPKSQTIDDNLAAPGSASRRLSRSNSSDAGANSKKKITAADMKGVDSKLAHMILDEVIDQGSDVTFKDVVGNAAAKEALKTAAILPALRPDLYTGLRCPPKGILFFGPPGNGKTLLAKAVACESNCVFFCVSASSLMSKWVGEAEKLVKTLFHLARKLQPTVIFIDEVDALLSKRKENEHDVSRRVKTQFLVEMDGVTSKSSNDRVLILAATNRPSEIDDAIIRRFSKRIHIGMPDVDTRKQLLQNLLSRHDKVAVSEHELNDLATLTQNYSASDLTNLAAEAAMEPINSLPLEELTAVKSSNVRAVNMSDFTECMKRIRPSVPPESLKHFQEWNDMYGDVSSS